MISVEHSERIPTIATSQFSSMENSLLAESFINESAPSINSVSHFRKDNSFNSAQAYDNERDDEGNAGITVIKLTENNSSDFNNSRFVLDSLLSFASYEDNCRWATFITSDPVEYFRLQRLKLNSSKLRIVYLKNKADLLWVTWDALAEGNSHTVIIQSSFNQEEYSSDIYDNLNTAAHLGNTKAILLNKM